MNEKTIEDEIRRYIWKWRKHYGGFPETVPVTSDELETFLTQMKQDDYFYEMHLPPKIIDGIEVEPPSYMGVELTRTPDAKLQRAVVLES